MKQECQKRVCEHCKSNTPHEVCFVLIAEKEYWHIKCAWCFRCKFVLFTPKQEPQDGTSD